MIQTFQRLHSYFYGCNHRYDYKKTNKIKWLFANIFSRFFERLVYCGFLIRGVAGFLPKPLDNNHAMVVSFTSFPARINTVWMVVDSLMRQTYLPKSINLYLSIEQFPNKHNDLPQQLLRYEKLGLNIFWVEDDLKPHKKYFYISQTLNNECFVTVDDDLLYRNDMLERVWELHLKYPNAVCANIGRKIKMIDGVVCAYSKWESLLDNNIHSGKDILAIGCGGILYPPSFYKQTKLICDEKTIKELCLRADDLWLKTMELITNTPVIVKSYYATAASIPSTSKSALSITNRENGMTGNDDQWIALDKRFHLCRIIVNDKRLVNEEK